MHEWNEDKTILENQIEYEEISQHQRANTHDANPKTKLKPTKMKNEKNHKTQCMNENLCNNMPFDERWESETNLQNFLYIFFSIIQLIHYNSSFVCLFLPEW